MLKITRKRDKCKSIKYSNILIFLKISHSFYCPFYLVTSWRLTLFTWWGFMSLKIEIIGVTVILGLSWWFVCWIQGISLQLQCPQLLRWCWVSWWAAPVLGWVIYRHIYIYVWCLKCMSCRVNVSWRSQEWIPGCEDLDGVNFENYNTFLKVKTGL